MSVGGVYGQSPHGNGRFQIRKWDDTWYLIRPDGWAYYYFRFTDAIKWLDYTIERYTCRNF